MDNSLKTAPDEKKRCPASEGEVQKPSQVNKERIQRFKKNFLPSWMRELNNGISPSGEKEKPDETKPDQKSRKH